MDKQTLEKLNEILKEIKNFVRDEPDRESLSYKIEEKSYQQIYDKLSEFRFNVSETGNNVLRIKLDNLKFGKTPFSKKSELFINDVPFIIREKL